MKRIIFVLLFIILLTGCQKSLHVKEEVIVEYGNPIPTQVKDYLDFEKIDEDKKEELLKDTKIEFINVQKEEGKDYQDVGEYQVKLLYNKEETEVKVYVKDTTKPQFIDFKETIDTYQDVKVDYMALFKADDLSKVKYTVDDSKVDYQKEGQYQATITAIDEYENKQEKSFVVNVKKPELQIQKTNITLNVGENTTLETTIKGKENKASFKSLNHDIVAVSQDGKITAKKVGKTKIQVKANDIIKECLVEVKEKVVKNSDFVRVKDYIPTLFVDLKYATKDNFTHQVIYDFKEAYLRYGTVKKLKKVQDDLLKQGYSLKIWDGYRPFEAQKTLWSVVSDSRYVANPNKGPRNHNLGGTVDLTLVKKDGTVIPMPTEFDDFSKKADRDYSDISNQEAIRHAQILEKAMVKYGFSGYKNEWWHYNDTVKYTFVDYKPKK